MSNRSAFDDLPPSYDEVMKNSTDTTTVSGRNQISDSFLQLPKNVEYSTSEENIPLSNSSFNLSAAASQINHGTSSRSAQTMHDSNEEYLHSCRSGSKPSAPVLPSAPEKSLVYSSAPPPEPVLPSAPPTEEILQGQESETEPSTEEMVRHQESETKPMHHAISISLVLKYPTRQRVINMIQLLSTMSYEKRLEVSSAHYRKYEVILAQIFEKLFVNYTPDIRDLMIGLVLPYSEYLGDSIKNTYDMGWIRDFVFTLSSSELKGISDYLLHFNINVELLLKAKLPIVSFNKEGLRLHAAIIMLKVKRNEDTDVNEEKLDKDLSTLIPFSKSQRIPIAKERALIEIIFYHRNFNHIKALSERYFSETGVTVISLIERIFPDSSKTFLNILEYSVNKQSYFANLLRSLLTSKKLFFDTKIDTQLSSIILARSKVGDLKEIQQQYYTLFGEQLTVRITKRTVGLYKFALHCLLGSTTTNFLHYS